MVWEGFPCANPLCPPTPFRPLLSLAKEKYRRRKVWAFPPTACERSLKHGSSKSLVLKSFAWAREHFRIRPSQSPCVFFTPTSPLPILESVWGEGESAERTLHSASLSLRKLRPKPLYLRTLFPGNDTVKLHPNVVASRRDNTSPCIRFKHRQYV